MSGKSEASLLAEVKLAIGARRDLMSLRINTGKFAAPAGGGRTRMVQSAPNGTADILCVQRRVVDTIRVINPDSFTPYEKRETITFGQAIAIETKTAKGRQREAQVNWQAAWENAGGIYILARSVADVLAVLGPDSPVTT